MSSEENHEQSHERIERQIAFIVDQQAKFLTDIEQLKEVQARTSESVDKLAGVVSELAGTVSQMDARMDRFEAQAESDRQEIREAINNLILANEVTRKFAQDIAGLAATTSQRVTKLEDQA